VTTTMALPIGSGVWTVDAPDNVTVTTPPAATPTLKITVDYQPSALFGGQTHGIIDLKFTEPAGNVDNFGIRYDYIFEFKNSLGVPVDGFVLYNSDELPVVDPDIHAPGGHPQKYAHFHGVEADTFSPLSSKVLLQDFVTPANFGGAAPTNIAPGQIQASGTIGNGESVTGKNIVLHQWEQHDINDNFHISLFPMLNSGQILVAALPAEQSQSEGNGETKFTFTVGRAGDGGAIDTATTTVDYFVVGTGENPVNGADFVGGSTPHGTITFNPDENTKTIEFTVAGDPIEEANETFRIELANPSGSAVVVNPGDAIGTIVNDDVTVPPTVKDLTAGDDIWPGPGFPGDSNGGDEIINGLDGNDTLTGGPGNDVIDGGAGKDTAIWSSFRLTSTIAILPNADDTVSGPDGNDTVRGVETFAFMDGQYITDTGHAAAQVYRLYHAALDRAPDMNGLKSWTDALTSGATTLKQEAEVFATSPEFVSKYGNLDDTGYITLLYQNALDRDPDPGGLASWVGGLKAGMSRAEVLVSFSESEEHIGKTSGALANGLWLRDDQAASLARLYDTTLDRLPDAPGLAAWKGGLAGGMTLQQITDAFTGSTEFTSKYGGLDNKAFVEQLYLNALDRQGEPSGVDSWTKALDSGTTRTDVVLAFSESQEHQDKLAHQIDDGIWLL
jgi:hypothetical protein